MDLSLRRMQTAVELAGGCNFPIIQVLGTNGKGSTSAFLASLAQAHGLVAGLYTSPHFVSIKERVLINGRQADDAAWLAAINELEARMPELLRQLTYFELLTVLAVFIFRQTGVQIAVFEAGLGGRHDATTALGADWHCFTPIAMDHANVLGPTLADIASDKAAAINTGAHVFTTKQYPQAMAILRKKAQLKQAGIMECAPLSDGPAPGLPGMTQFANAGLALACWRAFAHAHGIASSPAAEATGLARTFLPGRLQIVEHPLSGMPMILDGAHNAHAMQALLRQLPFEPETIIFSALADKDWHATLGMLLRKLPRAQIFMPQLDNSRAEDAGAMAAWALRAGAATARTFSCAASVAEAAATVDNRALLCGSLYLLAEFYKIYPQFLGRQKDDI